MPAQAYGIPVIFQDLRQEEALLQMFDSLEMLEKTMNDVYEKVATRVSVECGRVARVRQRLAVANEKLSIIRGNEKATTVFSPGKYPAPKLLEDFVPMYNSINPLSRIVHPDYDLDEDVEFATRGIRKPQEDFDFLRKLTRAEPEQDQKQGLGRLPSYLPTVSSLLLFNTSENPYKEFRLLDNTQGTEGPAMEVEQPKGPRGDGIKSGQLAQLEKDTINKPTWTKEAAPLVFPENLPDIGQIAAHDWKHAELPSIAPSFEANQLAALPAPPVAAPSEDSMPSDLPVPPAAPAPVQAPAPAPLPTPPQDLPQPPAPAPAPPVQAPSPAPADLPVPPPAPEPPAPEPVEPTEPEEEAPKLPSMPTNFLDEIKGFKKVALRKADKDKDVGKKKADTGPDMMSRILARGKMMKGEKGPGANQGEDKIAMPKPGQKEPPKKRAPAPPPAPSINDLVLVRRGGQEESEDEGDWSASESD